MRITVQTPTPNGLGSVVAALDSWQRDGIGIQLHSGDLGWHWRFGADVVARCLRVWTREQQIVAIGFVESDIAADQPTVIRMAVAPAVDDDQEVARVLVSDLEDPSAGVLRPGPASVEARFGRAFRTLLDARGWLPDESWTPLRRDLTHDVEDCALRIERVGPLQVEDRVDVQLAAFAGSTFTAERWHAMSTGVPYQQARCLVGYDDTEAAVAAITVWSAGPGRPGLIEPMGVDREHRGAGHGTAITVAGAAALRELGSSSVIVATPTANTGGIATYAAAGFDQAPPVTDFRRPSPVAGI